MVHCIFSLLNAAISLQWKSKLITVECEDKRQYENMTCHKIEQVYEAEFKLIEGIEAATVTFSVSVFVFAMVTLLLLKCSGGRQENPISYGCCQCYETVCSCKMVTLLVIQAIFSCIPRVLFFTLDCYMAQKAKSLFEIDYLKTGIVDEETVFVFAVICDSLATAMLTPWYCFKKKKKEDENSFDDYA